MNHWLPIGIGILALVLIPFMPTLLRIRIKIFRWLHWRWAVEVMETHFQRWVLFFRILVLVIGVALITVGLTEPNAW